VAGGGAMNAAAAQCGALGAAVPLEAVLAKCGAWRRAAATAARSPQDVPRLRAGGAAAPNAVSAAQAGGAAASSPASSTSPAALCAAQRFTDDVTVSQALAEHSRFASAGARRGASAAN
jgi:hypothetical protein